LYLTGHQHDCLRIACLALGVTAVLVPSLAWKFGITGAAAAYAGTVICWTALLYRAVREKLGIQPLISARPTALREI
jgi:O-antigen/teichoic acid export membrane protein